jgi:U3 small nucleolar RNA-associated protein 20
LEDLHSYRGLNEIDYERRLRAYVKLLELLPSLSLSEMQMWTLLHVYVALVRHDDLSLRSNASHGLQCFIRHIAQSPQQYAHAIPLLHTVLFPLLRRLLPTPSLVVRQEVVSSMATLIECFRDRYAELTPLLGSNNEMRFFDNIAHLQLLHRQRAVARLRRLCEQKIFSQPTLISVFVPLLRQMLMESPNAEHPLTQECVRTFGSIASCLNWRAYRSLLLSFLRLLRLNSTHEKIFLNVCVQLLEVFPFPIHITPDEQQLLSENQQLLQSFPSSFASLFSSKRTRTPSASSSRMCTTSLPSNSDKQNDAESESKSKSESEERSKKGNISKKKKSRKKQQNNLDEIQTLKENDNNIMDTSEPIQIQNQSEDSENEENNHQMSLTSKDLLPLSDEKNSSLFTKLEVVLSLSLSLSLSSHTPSF